MTIAEHLADFGDTKKQRTRRRKSKYDAARCKSVAPYQHVVTHAPSVPNERHVGPVGRPDPEWRERYPATRSLSDRAPFAVALSGYDPDRVRLEGYACWTVP